MQFHFTTSLILALGTKVMAGIAGETGDFLQTCTNIGIAQNSNDGGQVLAAQCRTIGGQYLSTAISLDNCLGNNNGQLTCPGAAYGVTCRGCYIEKNTQVLNCNCKGPSSDSQGWAWINSAIDLNGCVGNCDGDLCC